VTIWAVLLGAGAVTYGIRLSVLVFVRHDALPDLVREALRYLLPAVLVAIIAPAVLYVGDDDNFSAALDNERLLAALIAGAVAWATQNAWLTVSVGMAALWLLQWAM